MKMTDEEKAEVSHTIEQEGLDYGLRNYSNFEEIEDPEFHQRRLAYIKAAEEFEQYINYDENCR